MEIYELELKPLETKWVSLPLEHHEEIYIFIHNEACQDLKIYASKGFGWPCQDSHDFYYDLSGKKLKLITLEAKKVVSFGFFSQYGIRTVEYAFCFDNLLLPGLKRELMDASYIPGSKTKRAPLS
jgi:hypothetical protein